MKTLRIFVALNGLGFLFLGTAMALYPYPVQVHFYIPVHEIPLLRAVGVVLGAYGLMLLTMARLSLLSGHRRVALQLSITNLLIAGIAGLPIAKQGHAAGIGLVLLSLSLTVVLAWIAGQSIGTDEIVEALPIPEEVRRSWLRQIGEAAIQEERNRLARDLHDSIKQQLFTVNVSTAAAQELWEQDPERAKAALIDVRRSAREAMVEMQALLHQLQPQALASAGLIEALRKQCEALGYRTGAEVLFELGEAIPDDRLQPGAQEALFRIAQEALSNVARHARARRVRVCLGREGDVALLQVADNGQGFDRKEARAGTGLRSLRERAESLRGNLEIDSAPGAGTAVLVRIPLTSPPAAQAKIEPATLQEWRRYFLLSMLAAFWLPHPIVLPAPRFSPALFIVSLLMSAIEWSRRARQPAESSPGSQPASIAGLQYIGRRDSALAFFLAAGWASELWRFGKVASVWTIVWLAIVLLCLGMTAVELVRVHRVSEVRPRWWRLSLLRPTPAKLIFFASLGCILAFEVGTLWLGSYYNPKIWARLSPLSSVDIGFRAAGVIILLYLHSRRPRSEGASG